MECYMAINLQLWSALHSKWNTVTFCASCSCVAWQPYYFPVEWTSTTKRMASANSHYYRMWCRFAGIRPKRKSIDQNQEHLINKNNQFETVFSAVPLDSLRKSVELVSSRLQKRAKCWNLCSNLTLNGSVLALKWCKNCNYMASILVDTVILLWCTCFPTRVF
jgi:hypothetical protein